MFLCLLLILVPTTANAISPYLKVDPPACTITNKRYWTFIEWFYGETSYVYITMMYETRDDLFRANYQDKFLKGIFSKQKYSINYKYISHDHEEKHTSYANTFSWQGDRLPIRHNQSQYIQHRRKRQILSYEPTVPVRKDEPKNGAFILTDRISTINKYLYGSVRRPFRFPRRIFVIAVMSNVEANLKLMTEKVLERLWLEYGIGNIVIMTPCNGSSEYIATYLPFEKQTIGNRTRWGAVKWTHLHEFNFSDLWIFRKYHNMQGFKLRVSLFRRYPTAVLADEVPTPFMKTYFMNIRRESNNYTGIDGIVLGNMARALNFEPVIVQIKPNSSDFGYKLSNGTFIGSIGDILYRQTYVSFNGRFMTDYGTDEIEYMFPIFFDKLCVIAPKALKVPEWMAIFKCFDVTVWSLILITNSFCGIVWYFLKETTLARLREKKKKRSPSNVNDKFGTVFIEMWVIMLSGPSLHLPKRFRERILITGCILANVIIAGSFQGSLTTSFSTVSYYKDINTLEDLDESGLYVATSSGSLRNLFGSDTQENEGKPAVRSLAKKFLLLNVTEPIITRAATRRDICSIERLTDIGLILATRYELPDGSVLLHVVKDCPRAYYMSYIVKKGWPLLPEFSNKIIQLFEAGLLHVWYEELENAIISHTRLHRPSMPSRFQAFTLVDVQTAFYILGFGLLGCFLVFLAELYVMHRTRSKFKQNGTGAK